MFIICSKYLEYQYQKNGAGHKGQLILRLELERRDLSIETQIQPNHEVEGNHVI